MGRAKKPSEKTSPKRESKTPVSAVPIKEVLVDHEKPDDVSYALIRRRRKKAPDEPMSEQSLLSMSIAKASFHPSSVAGSTRSKKSGFSQSVRSGVKRTFNFSKYKIKVNKQPSHEALRKAVDHYYKQMDPKKNTVADMYRAVEDHFVLELSKPNRKFVRHRLVELSMESNVDENPDPEESTGVVESSSKSKDGADSPSKTSKGHQSKRSTKSSKSDQRKDDKKPTPVVEVQFEKNDPDGTGMDEHVVAAEEGRPLMRSKQTESERRKANAGMETAVLRFQKIDFVVGKGDQKKFILKNVSGKVKAGREFPIELLISCLKHLSSLSWSDHFISIHPQMFWPCWDHPALAKRH